MSRRQNAVDVPFKQPNWLGAILFLISSIIHVTTKSKWPIIYQNSSHDYQKKQRAQRSYSWTWLPSNFCSWTCKSPYFVLLRIELYELDRSNRHVIRYDLFSLGGSPWRLYGELVLERICSTLPESAKVSDSAVFPSFFPFALFSLSSPPPPFSPTTQAMYVECLK